MIDKYLVLIVVFVFSGYPRYCTVTTLPDNTTVLNGGRSRRGKPRGPPGSRELQTALKGCDDPLFLDFIRRCLEWDPATRMSPNAALRHAWLRRRLPRPPPGGSGSNGGSGTSADKLDSPSGTLNSLRSANTASGSRTSSQTTQKMNTIGAIHTSAGSAVSAGNPTLVAASAKARPLADMSDILSRHPGSGVTMSASSTTKLPQIS